MDFRMLCCEGLTLIKFQRKLIQFAESVIRVICKKLPRFSLKQVVWLNSQLNPPEKFFFLRNSRNSHFPSETNSSTSSIMWINAKTLLRKFISSISRSAGLIIDSINEILISRLIRQSRSELLIARMFSARAASMFASLSEGNRRENFEWVIEQFVEFGNCLLENGFRDVCECKLLSTVSNVRVPE